MFPRSSCKITLLFATRSSGLRCRRPARPGVPPPAPEKPADLEKRHGPDEHDAQDGVDLEQVAGDEEQDEVGEGGHVG